MRIYTKQPLTYLLLLTAAFLVFNKGFAQTFTPKYNTKVITKVNGYYEYLPQGYSSTGTTVYPTIISIGGIGEMGDGSTSTSTGLPKIFGDTTSPALSGGLATYIKRGRFPVSFTIPNTTTTKKFIVICPQFQDPNNAAYPTPLDVDSVISYVIKNYKVDQTRIYLTGFSVGGGICWDYSGYSNAFANRVAAIVPIAGGTNDSLATKARTLTKANLPSWATHNDQDNSVPVAITNRWIDSINRAPSPNPLARKTIFQAYGHEGWTTTYDIAFKESISGYNYNIYQWMLRYQRIPLTVSATSNSPVRTVDTLKLVANITYNAYSPVTIKWTGPNGFSVYSRTPTIVHPTTAATGTYTVTLSQNGQSKTATTSVTITSGPTTQINNTVAPEASVKQLNVTAQPNPSTNYFTIVTHSVSNKPLQIKVADAVGRIVETKNNITANGTLTIGQQYRQGIYYIEVSQGTTRTIIKAIKQKE